MKELLTISQEVYSLDYEKRTSEESYGGNDTHTILDVLKDKRMPPEQDTFKECLNSDINYVLKKIFQNGNGESREYRILELRFGLNGKTPLALEEVGDILGISKERVRQIQKASILKLRKSPEAQFLRNYFYD